MAGGGFGEIDVEEGMRAEGLSLDANWRGGDKGLEVLRDLPEITSINIHGAQLGDEALAHIAALPRLTNLSIRGTKFSVAALRKLHAARPRAYLFCQGEAMVGIHADTAGSCVLTSVYGGSGAADAGLREGDRIVSIDGVEIRDFSELTISVYGHGVGEKLKIEYERDGKRQTAQVELKARAVLEP
jgi:predicted metalloprotease with PDZ domain